MTTVTAGEGRRELEIVEPDQGDTSTGTRVETLTAPTHIRLFVAKIAVGGSAGGAGLGPRGGICGIVAIEARKGRVEFHPAAAKRMAIALEPRRHRVDPETIPKDADPSMPPGEQVVDRLSGSPDVVEQDRVGGSRAGGRSRKTVGVPIASSGPAGSGGRDSPGRR